MMRQHRAIPSKVQVRISGLMKTSFILLYKKISGDFILTADFAFTGDTAGAVGHRKIGWMIRESVAPDAVSMNGCKHIDGLIAMQWRVMKGAFMQDPEGEIFLPKEVCKPCKWNGRVKRFICVWPIRVNRCSWWVNTI